MLRVGLVRVAVNHRRETLRRRIDVQLREVVQDIETVRTRLDDLRQRQRLPPGAAIVVAAHGMRRRKLAQLLQDRRVADVARMDDEVATAKRIDRFGAQESVRIGDHPDLFDRMPSDR